MEYECCSKLLGIQLRSWSKILDLSWMPRVFLVAKIVGLVMYQERQTESAVVRQLLHEWNKLFIAGDGILYHKSGSRNRMLFSKKYHKGV